ncbi:MAG TPA: ATP-dependent helicase C-terminal domain-containing protein [Verrucomicrobiae bacterium]|nr:ATP-dependent helicase C-terminal domain-containing protein [Verrucomicrobiae bacterium]
MDPLPIDAHLGEIAAQVRARRALVLVAPPGAGKTTRVPPALIDDGPLILLQPRRVAARALARRIAAERGWTLGEEIGWQVRFERRFSPRTRLLVATEGILTARLVEDPLLAGFRTIVLDEFHERSLHADMAIALARQAFLARDDLRLVVMSATLDAGPVAEFLGGCRVMQVAGRPHPVAIEHRPSLPLGDAVAELLDRQKGDVLCFLPGAAEIRRAQDETAAALRRSGAFERCDLLPLHGSLDAEAQERALAPSPKRKVILATNIAETSLTVEGVTAVVDSGLHKVLRHDPERGIDRLQTERIPLDAALQRAGRAGRTAPGRVVRLWDAAEILRPRREPEIARVDLAGALLDILAWGEDARRFAWFEAPPPGRIDAALLLLERLEAVQAGRVTARGRIMRRLPLHPRMGRLLEAAGGSPSAAACCAVLSEEWAPPRTGQVEATASDLLSRVDRLLEAPARVRQAAAELHRLAERLLEGGGEARDDETSLRRAILSGWPDRVARRRAPGSDKFVLASGHGAVLGRESGVRDGEFVVALDVVGGSSRSGASEALIRMASRVEADWIAATRQDKVHVFDAAAGKVRAFERTLAFDLVLREIPVAADPAAAGEILAAALVERGPDEAATALLRRLRFAAIEADLASLIRDACAGRVELPARLDLASGLPAKTLKELARLAPETIPLPSGRSARLDYREDGGVGAAVKLQELFGLGETPRIGPRKEPVVFELLAPNGRPVQTTRDLHSFWEKTYPEVRKELRGRYPKHPWPEDPWTATPTHRTTRRPKR